MHVSATLQIYGPEMVSMRGPIPAHILHSMFATSWHLHRLVTPFPNKISIDVTDEMIAQVSERVSGVDGK